jgi:hypothetical protein
LSLCATTASFGECVVEIHKLKLITGTDAGDDAMLLAQGIKDDKCFTLGQGSDAVKDLFDTVEEIKFYSVGHIVFACVLFLVSLGSICYHSSICQALYRRFRKRRGDGSVGQDTGISPQKMEKPSAKPPVLMHLLASLVELAYAAYIDWYKNTHSLQRDFNEVRLDTCSSASQHTDFVCAHPNSCLFFQVLDAFGNTNGQLEDGGEACAYASETARLDLEGPPANGSFACGSGQRSSSMFGPLVFKTDLTGVLVAVLPCVVVWLLYAALLLKMHLRRRVRHHEQCAVLPAALPTPAEQNPVQSTRIPAQASVQVDEIATVTHTHDPAWSDHVKVDAKPSKPTRASEQRRGAVRVVLAEAVCKASLPQPRIKMPHPCFEIRGSRRSSDRSSRASSSRGSLDLRSSAQQRVAHLYSRVSELASEASPGRRISMRFARRASQAQVEAAQVRGSVTERDSGRSSRFSGLSARISDSGWRVSQPVTGGPVSPEQLMLTTRPRRGSARVLHVGLSPGSPRSPAPHHLQVSAAVEARTAAEGSPALVHSGAGSFEAAVREPRRANELNTTSL